MNALAMLLTATTVIAALALRSVKVKETGLVQLHSKLHELFTRSGIRGNRHGETGSSAC